MSELDKLVINTELTLISIIQGVALSFLAQSTHGVIATGRYEFLPYSVIGLIVICTVWSRSILHALTIVRWPLELVHGLLYILLGLGQSLTYSSLDAPARWFALSTATAIVVWVTYGFDLGMVDRCDRGGPGRELYDLVRRDQLFNLRLAVPASIALCGLSAIAIWAAPGPLVAGRGHLILAAVQGMLCVAYLAVTLALARRLVPLIEPS